MDYHGNILTYDGFEIKFTAIDSTKEDDCIFIGDGANLFFKNKLVFLHEKNKKLCISTENLSNYRIDFHSKYIRIGLFGVFLSSRENGEVILHRIEDTWETFLPISKEFFNTICYLKRNFLYRNINFSIENFYMNFNEKKFSIEKNEFSILENERLILIDEDLCLHEIEKFNPVIYFCAFSSEEIIKSSLLSINSFIEHSNVDFTYILFTNIIDFDFPNNIPYLKIIFIPSFGIISHLYKRYSAEIMYHLRDYSPIFYSDSDIICNNDIKEIALKVFDSKKLYVNSEKDRDYNTIINSGWFISDFNKHDKEIINENILPINSGFFGFRNIEFFKVASYCMDAISNNIIKKHDFLHYAFDQSTFNYVIMKFYEIDIELFQKFIINWPAEDFSEISRCGIVHFCGGVGEFSSKYEKMLAYSDYINTPFLESVTA